MHLIEAPEYNDKYMTKWARKTFEGVEGAAEILVEVNKDNHIKKYFFNKKNGIKILDKIQKITSHYDNEQLNNDFLNLKYITKENWYDDGGIIGL